MSLLVCLAAIAQNQHRAYVKSQIDKWGLCRTVAITKKGGAVAITQTNAYTASGIPKAMEKALKRANEKGYQIDDVVLTDKGSWLVLYANNGIDCGKVPKNLENQLRALNKAGEKITSVTFNDAGEWIVVTATKAVCSYDIYDWIADGEQKYGKLLTAHITGNGLAMRFERGYKFDGVVPEALKDRLKSTKIDVYRIKFWSDGTYFFADRKGNYSYKL